jgi:quinol monooxygenase YgiN
MFSQIVTMHLKPNRVAEFAKNLEERVLPILRKQEGFKDEFCLVAPDGLEAIAISLWDRKENLESYRTTAYPQAVQTLTDVLVETPQTKNYDVSSSTFHKIATKATA